MGAGRGIFFGVSVGPGDPELLTRKACRVLEACPVIGAAQTARGEQLALSIARRAVDLTGKEILSLPFSMARDLSVRQAAWRRAAAMVWQVLDRGQDVAMVVLGDVSIYSTYCYLMELLREEGYETEMIPGVASFSAVAARLGVSLTTMEEPLHILPASQQAQWEGLTPVSYTHTRAHGTESYQVSRLQPRKKRTTPSRHGPRPKTIIAKHRRGVTIEVMNHHST